MEEMANMRKRHVQVMHSLEDLSHEKQEVLKNVYGIESYHSKKKRQERIRLCQLAVLCEQERQWDEAQEQAKGSCEGCYDTERLYLLSSRISIVGREEARIRGSAIERSILNDKSHHTYGDVKRDEEKMTKEDSSCVISGSSTLASPSSSNAKTSLFRPLPLTRKNLRVATQHPNRQ